MILKNPKLGWNHDIDIYPVEWGRFCPGKMCDENWLPNTFIYKYILDQTQKKATAICANLLFLVDKFSCIKVKSGNFGDI